MANRIELKCPKCKKTAMVSREDTDPPAACVAVIQCPDCNHGDFDTPKFFAADGREVPFHEGLNL